MHNLWAALTSFLEQADSLNKLSGLLAIVIGVLIVPAYKGLRLLGLTRQVDQLFFNIRQYFENRFDERTQIQARWPGVHAFVNEIWGPVGVKAYGLRFDAMPMPVYADAKDELPHILQKGVLTKAADIRARNYFPPKGENLSHGLVVDDQYQHMDARDFKVVRTDYATICALRELQQDAMIVSAGALLFDSQTRTIFLQKRSQKSHTHPSQLHTFGGNYEPTTGVALRDHREVEPLRFTAIREVDEETRLGAIDPGKAVILVADQLAGFEVSTGFVQFYYLGVDLTKKQIANLRGSAEEGQVIRMSLEDLKSVFKTGHYKDTAHGRQPAHFVPAGAMHILVWLGLGAPDQNLRCPMREEALQAYAEISRDIRSYMATYGKA